jgi:hypothetical protein
MVQHLQEMSQRLAPTDKLADLREEDSPQLHDRIQKSADAADRR